jgi:hypothetical protein
MNGGRSSFTEKPFNGLRSADTSRCAVTLPIAHFPTDRGAGSPQRTGAHPGSIGAVEALTTTAATVGVPREKSGGPIAFPLYQRVLSNRELSLGLSMQ